MHSRTYLRRLAGITAALMLLTGLLTGTVAAKPPAYSPKSFTGTPAFASYGALVRFDVAFTNDSGANLPSVRMAAETPDNQNVPLADDAEFIDVVAGPTVNNVPQGTCTGTSALLTCDIGTVMAGATVRFSAVYRVPTYGTSFSVPFVFLAQGSTPSDSPRASRGDDMPVTGTVALITDDERGASLIFGGNLTVANAQGLSKRNNPQSAKLTFPAGAGGTQGFAASVVEETPGNVAYACPPAITTCFGNWNVVSVNGGVPVPGGYLVQFGYYQVTGNANSVRFIHLLNASGTLYEEIDDCVYEGGVPVTTPCISGVSSTQGTYLFTIFFGPTDPNGPMRGY